MFCSLTEEERGPSRRKKDRRRGLSMVSFQTVFLSAFLLPSQRGAPEPSPLSSSHTSRSLKKTKVYHDKVYCVESHADILNIIHLKPNMLFILQVSTSLFYQYYRFSFISSKPEWAKCFKSIFTVNPYSNPGDRQMLRWPFHKRGNLGK